ncbi:hypothetical protein P8452_27041 [Trifolium repens]|nr:hypothetical protein P8452_27041 [Trifolium repens]
MARSFEIIIDPQMSRIPIPKNFCKNWKAEIVKHRYGWICGDEYAVMVIFHLSDSRNYLTSRCAVAKKFGFAEQTKVVLEYTIEDNQFEMKVLPTNRHQIHVPGIIEIGDSDDESIHHQNPPLNVTPRISTSKKQKTPYTQNRMEPNVVLPTNESTQTFKRNQQKRKSANVETTSGK